MNRFIPSLQEGMPASLYRDIEVRTVRSRIRKVMLDAKSRFPDAVRGLERPRVQFIYLHYVFLDEEKNFRDLITRLLERGHRFLSHSNAVKAVAEGRFDEPTISISFDDGVANCMRAAEILNGFNISACFYLSSGLLGEQRNARPMLMTATQYAKQPVEYMSWDDAAKLGELGHEIGGHTRNHVNIASLTESQFEEEIHEDRRILKQRLGEVDHFAWPFGRPQHFSHAGRKHVFDAGYATCASAIRGAHVAIAGDRQFCIRRDNVVAAWPVQHNLHLIAKSAREATAEMNQWPSMKEHA